MTRAIDMGGASALPAFVAPMRTAALATLAEAAAHWSEADTLAFVDGRPSAGVIATLNASRDRILSEAAAMRAETRDGLRYKAQIITGLEAAALKDDASMSGAGLALLRSIMDDLTWEGGKA